MCMQNNIIKKNIYKNFMRIYLVRYANLNLEFKTKIFLGVSAFRIKVYDWVVGNVIFLIKVTIFAYG